MRVERDLLCCNGEQRAFLFLCTCPSILFLMAYPPGGIAKHASRLPTLSLAHRLSLPAHELLTATPEPYDTAASITLRTDDGVAGWMAASQPGRMRPHATLDVVMAIILVDIAPANTNTHEDDESHENDEHALAGGSVSMPIALMPLCNTSRYRTLSYCQMPPLGEGCCREWAAAPSCWPARASGGFA